MANEKKLKKSVWKNIFRLILPYKKKFLWVVTLGLLSTGASLIEPLIYREAINDVAGIFVKQARENARKDLGLSSEDYQDIRSMIEDEVPSDSTGPADTITGKKIPEGDTAEKISSLLPGAGKDTAAAKKLSKAGKNSRDKAAVSHSKSSSHQKGAKKEKKITDTVPKPEPHTQGHVAARSPSQALNTLLWAVFWLFVINLIGTLLWRLSENTNTRLSCLIEQTFIQGTFAHVLNLPLSFFTKRSSAAIAKQIDQSEEVTGIVNGFSQQILPELISLLGILVIMFWQNVALTLVALIAIPFYLVIAWRSAKKLESGLASYYSKWEEVSTRIQDGLTGIKTVKLSGAEDREEGLLKTISDSAYKDYVNRTRLANKYVFWETMLSHLSTALVFGYGGYLTLQNKLTPGDVVMFVAYLDRLYGPIDALASLWVELQQNVASIARAFRLLDSGTEEKSGTVLAVREGRIEFKDVHFSYNAEREVLKGISFTLAPGKATAIVGASGAGKTTTVDLLLKLYEPTAGKILLDGQDLNTLDAASVRSQIGLVSTDGAVFRGTLADNIRYKRPEASDTEVHNAALAAGLQATLQRLPEGLQTIVGERGIGLSVGERQRIQIARVLAASPRILVLDEATANLDFATEAEVKKTVEEIRRSHTVIIIAHRYSMVRDADHVIVLSEGEVVEEGSPAELMAREGWFAEFAGAAEEEQEEDFGSDEEAETADTEEEPDNEPGEEDEETTEEE